MTAEIDWKDALRMDAIHIMMVDPHNLDTIRGELSNVILDGCSITQGYNTDTGSAARSRSWTATTSPEAGCGSTNVMCRRPDTKTSWGLLS